MFFQKHKAASSSNQSVPQPTLSTIRNNVVSLFHHSMLVLGIAAITMLMLMFFKPELNNRFQAISPFTESTASPHQTAPHAVLAPALVMPAAAGEQKVVSPFANQNTAVTGSAKQQQTVASWLSKRYRVAYDAAHVFVSTSYVTAKELKIDPLLILSVMAIESGLNPLAESPVGAQGLMQVMSKIHEDKFDELGGIKEALNPVANIRVGAQILKEYVTRGGSVEAGLKMYVGAALAENDGGYGHKVLAEYRRLQEVANGKGATAPTIAAAKPAMIKVNAKVKKQMEAEQLAAI